MQLILHLLSAENRYSFHWECEKYLILNYFCAALFRASLEIPDIVHR